MEDTQTALGAKRAQAEAELKLQEAKENAVRSVKQTELDAKLQEAKNDAAKAGDKVKSAASDAATSIKDKAKINEKKAECLSAMAEKDLHTGIAQNLYDSAKVMEKKGEVAAAMATEKIHEGIKKVKDSV